MPVAFFHLRARSLLRGALVVLTSLTLALILSGFPHPHPAWYLAILAVTALWGTWETLRCLRLRWSFYHGGVLLFLYMDVLALTLILFLLIYPYAG
ncbi:permease [Silvibacterium sp.]|uniref:permease n=1 Tax=Silvibacterium sp. TaxID=1964179 RepID=UPI0039E4430C